MAGATARAAPHEPEPAAAPAEQAAATERSNSVPPWEDLPPEANPGRAAARKSSGGDDAAAALPGARDPAVTRDEPSAPAAEPAPVAGEWHGIQRALGLGGMVRELAQHCEWVGFGDGLLSLRLSETHRHLLDMNSGLADRLCDALAAHFGQPVTLRIETGAIAGETPAQRDRAEKRARHVEAVAALECDPFVRELIERFDATLVEASVRPL